MISNNSTLKSPPVHNFVKITKEIHVTRCFKKPSKEQTKENKVCETRAFRASGSGVLVDLVNGHATVLSAGHVCTSNGTTPVEDKLYKFSWVENLSILTSKNKTFRAHIILAEQATTKSADLCSLIIPEWKPDVVGLKIERKLPKPGEAIYYMGAPLGIYHPPTVLLIKGIYNGKINKYNTSISAPAAPGSSGSAVLSLNNRIYGVVFAVVPSFPTATLMTSYEKTKNFLERTQKTLELFILQRD